MPGIKDLQQLSKSKSIDFNQTEHENEDNNNNINENTMYTDDGGIRIGKGWIQYFHEESDNNFYTHEEFGTQWDYPSDLLIKDENTDSSIQIIERPDTGGGIVSTLFDDVDNDDDNNNSDLEEIELRDEFDNNNNENKQMISRPEEDDETDESDDDDILERGRRLGGGFRSLLRSPTPPDHSIDGDGSSSNNNNGEGTVQLGEASANMLAKLQTTRAATNGDVMSNQAAFKSDGMLMLESIQKKGDPTTEESDPEAIARLEGERVRFQEEMEKVRDSFTDQELFKLREEFNDVDADRSGYIDDDELKILLTILNDSKVPSEDEVRRIMLEADASGDGQLDFLEFLALVKSLKDEKKANQSIIKSIKKFADTVKTDLLGGIIKDVDEYRDRAYRYFNADKIAKKEKREAEKARVRQEAEEERARIAKDREILAEEELKHEIKLEERDEETGLETEVLYDGNDIDFPDENDVVSIHIKLIIFDPNKSDPNTWEILENSRKRRQPFKFKCDGGAVIPGLALTVPKMSLGMKVRVIVPPEFAYGEKGLPPKVPPHTTLVIEVELLSFESNEGEDEII